MKLHLLWLVALLTKITSVVSVGTGRVSLSLCTDHPSAHPNSSSEYELTCAHAGDRIVIDLSHYGVYQSDHTTSYDSQNREECICVPENDDCIMNHVDRVAELCTGHDRCLISRQPQFVHKCSKYSNYIHISYQCIPAESTEHISSSSGLISDDVYLLSPDFPKDYSPNQKCECELTSSKQSALQISSMLFSTQEDFDILKIQQPDREEIVLSGSVAVDTLLTFAGHKARVVFQSDNTIGSSGFMLAVKALKKCPYGYDGVGSYCLRALQGTPNWFDYLKQCEFEGDTTLSWPNDVQKSKHILDWLQQLGVTEFWIDKKRKLKSSNDVDRIWSVPIPTVKSGKCIVHNRQGFEVVSCQRNATGICMRSRIVTQFPVSVQCNSYNGDYGTETSTFLDFDTRHGRLSSHTWMTHQQKRLAQVQGCLFWLLCTCVALVSMNFIICLTCFRTALTLPKPGSDMLELNKWGPDPNDVLTIRKGYIEFLKSGHDSYCSQCLRKVLPVPYHSLTCQNANVCKQHVYERVLADAVNHDKLPKTETRISATPSTEVDQRVYEGQSPCTCECHELHMRPNVLVSGPISRVPCGHRSQMCSNASAESGYSSNNR